MNSSAASLSAVRRAAVMLALILLVPSCASLGPPARTSGPSVSPEGIELVVAAQSCTQSSDTELPEEDLAEAILEVHVGNRTAADLTVRRDDFRLVTSDGYALRASSWGAADPLVVVGGETRAFELRFQTRGSLVCGSELRLEPRMRSLHDRSDSGHGRRNGCIRRLPVASRGAFTRLWLALNPRSSSDQEA
jgi:hypothetical protein